MFDSISVGVRFLNTFELIKAFVNIIITVLDLQCVKSHYVTMVLTHGVGTPVHVYRNFLSQFSKVFLAYATLRLLLTVIPSVCLGR